MDINYFFLLLDATLTFFFVNLRLDIIQYIN